MRCDRVTGMLATAIMATGLMACSGEPAPDAAAQAATAPAAGEPAPARGEEASLRDAASSALASQRIYSPAGDNAIEHYGALLAIRPDDASLAAAMLELLPYAVIGSEQAIERGDFGEARRLVALVQRVDPQFPALARLRDRIAATQLRETEQLALDAEAEVQRKQQELLDARREAEATTAAAAAVGTANTGTAAAAVPTVAASESQVPGSAPAVAAPTVEVPAPESPAVEAAPAASAALAAPVEPPAAVPAMPRLLSAPGPRYPVIALGRKLEGEVTLEFTIEPDGDVADARVVASKPRGVFDQAALAAVRGWKYESSGRSVKTSRVVVFRLEGGDS